MLVLIIALEWPEVNSTGTFVGKALETQLKLLERKHGMSASAERPRKKGTSKTKTHGLDAGAQILRKMEEKGKVSKRGMRGKPVNSLSLMVEEATARAVNQMLHLCSPVKGSWRKCLPQSVLVKPAKP